MQYHWPGNVREMENVIERAVLVCDEDTIRTIHLPANLQTFRTGKTARKPLLWPRPSRTWRRR